MPGVVARSCNASMGGSVGIDLIAAGQPVGVWVAALVTVPVWTGRDEEAKVMMV